MHALIVADDAAAAELMAREARLLQFEPELFRDVETALTAFQERNHPLVLATYGLGSVSGVDVCQGIRKIEERSRALIIVATAENADLETLLDAGADDYMIFPAETRTLRLRMRVAARRVRDRMASAQIENDLRLSNERFELAVQGTNDGLWDAFAPGHPWHTPDSMVWYSPRMKELFGYGDDEFPPVLSSWEKLLHPEDHAGIIKALQDHVTDRVPYDVEYRIRTKAGEYRWFSARGQAIWDQNGELLRMAGSVRDITETKLYERKLEEGDAKWRSLVDNAPDIIMLADLDGKIEFINRDTPGAQASIGRTIYDYIDPVSQVVERQAMEGIRKTGRPQRFEVRGPSEHGLGDIWYSTRLGPIVRDGRVDSVVLIATDITEKKLADERIKREQELLRRLLDLQERERQIVAYEIHDGLVQYLTAGLMHLESFAALSQREAGASNHEYETGTSLLRRSLTEARRLISGLRPPILDEQGVEAAIEYLINEARHDVPDLKFVNRAKLGKRLAAPLEVALFRIAQEGLSNIRRHSGAKRAEVQLQRIGDHVRLSVRDWGCGFDPKKVQEERFGLQGIRQRARLLGTTATISSAPGEGTMIVVDFPIVDAASGKST
jgi:PAS domain S-box-containing protein